MVKKIGIILAIVAIVAVSLFLYFGKNNITPNTQSPNKTTPVLSGTIQAQTGATQSGVDWNPEVMRTLPTIDNGSGVTITVKTNGPAGRKMSPEEMKEFQKKMQAQ